MKASRYFVSVTKEFSPRLATDRIDYELLLFYENNGWISFTEKENEVEVSYNGYIGILPLADKVSLAMIPKEFINRDSNSFFNLATFLVNHYGTDQNMMNYSSKESNRYTFEDVFTLHELALKLRKELGKIKNIPLTNFVREKRYVSTFTGKVDINSVIRVLYTRPGSRLMTEKNRIGVNSTENKIIKAAISKILRSDEVKHYRELRLTFKKLYTMFEEVENVDAGVLRNINIRNISSAYKMALVISKIILFDRSAANSKEILSLGVPLVKLESDFFEVLSREAIRFSYPSTDKGQFAASTTKNITFNPDIIIELPDLKLVGDSKYKTITPTKHGIDNKPDIYQLISHSLGYEDAGSLFLLYPQPPGEQYVPTSIFYDGIEPQRTVTAIWLDQEVLLKATTRRARDRRLHESIQELVNALISHHVKKDAA